jgi:hypothetical protein
MVDERAFDDMAGRQADGRSVEVTRMRARLSPNIDDPRAHAHRRLREGARLEEGLRGQVAALAGDDLAEARRTRRPSPPSWMRAGPRRGSVGR